MTQQLSADQRTETAQDDVAATGGRSKWYALALLSLIYIFSSVDKAVVSVIAEPLKHEFKLSDAQIGALGGLAFSVTFSLTVLPMGWLIDRVNRRNLLAATVATWSALTAICSVAPNFLALVVARMGVGAAEAPVAPGSLSLIADTFPRRQRSTALSLYYAGTALGQLVTFAGGGWLLMHFNWRALYLVAGIPGVILATLLFFTTKEPRRGAFDPPDPDASATEAGKRGPSIMHTVRAMLRNKRLLLALGGITVSTGVMYSLTVWTTSFLVRVHALSISEAAVWTGLAIGLVQTTGALIVGPTADRFSRGEGTRLALFPMFATLTAAFAGIVMVLAPGLPIAIAGLCLVSLCSGFFVTTGYSLVLSLAGPDVRGTTIAIAKLSATMFGVGLVPLLTGVISDAVSGPMSIRYAILSTFFLFFIATFCYWRIARGPRTQAA